MSSRYLCYFGIILIPSTWIMWPNYTVTEQVETAFQLKQGMKNFSPSVQVLHKTLNLVMSRNCTKIYNAMQSLCFSLKSYCFVMFSLLSPQWRFLKLPIRSNLEEL